MKLRLLTLLSTIALSALAVAADAASLKVGVVPGVYADSIEALNYLKKHYKLMLVTLREAG